MKKNCLFLLLASLSLSLAGQRKADIGIFAGASSYFGDINRTKPLYAPLPAAGVFYRYNLNPRQSIRTNLFLGGLRANDRDFTNAFQQSRGASFSGFVGEFAAQFEFNFFPYATSGKRWNYSPYIAAGAGLAFINTVVFTYQPVIPFSLGFKISFLKNFGLEAEYGFRKTFYDNFDGLKDLTAPSDYSWLHNNDWYTFAGISFTWKMYNKLLGCPAYNDVDSRRRKR